MGLPANGLALLGDADCVALACGPLLSGAVFTGIFPSRDGPAEFVCAVAMAVAVTTGCA